MNETMRCSSCGAELAEVTPHGLCPVCLLKLGLSDPNIPAPAELPGRTDPQQDIPPQPAGKKSSRLYLVLAGLLLLSIVVAAAFLQRQKPPQADVLRFEVRPSREAVDFAVSPDGRRVVFSIVNDEGTPQLRVHSFDAPGEQPLQGTEGAAFPFWSPDSRSVAFFAGGKLKRIELLGAGPQVLCDAPYGQSGAWSRDGGILFATNRAMVLNRVSASGGIPQPATSMDQSRPPAAHRWPYFLPDGRHFLYSVVSANSQNAGIFVASLDSKAVKRLRAGKQAAYAAGVLFFVQENVLMVQGFDPARQELIGEPWRIRFADDVHNFSVSAKGVLVYQNSKQADSPLLLVDGSGKALQRIDDAKDTMQFSVSPDLKMLAMSKSDGIWLSDLSRSVTSRFTFTADDSFPVWAPDGSRIAFLSNRAGAAGLYQKALNGAMEDLILRTGDWNVESIDDWSMDGRFITYTVGSTDGKSSVWALPMTGDRKAFPIPSSVNARQGRFSPDGRWLAYVSDESGKDEVYVQAFLMPGARWPVSTHGGANPRWRGHELFYVSPARTLMKVIVASSGDALQLSTVVPLLGGLPQDLYDIAPDGRQAADRDLRFLIFSQRESTPSSPINVVINSINER